MASSVGLFLFGAFILLVSTSVLIKQAELLSRSLKLSPLIIGITIVSIGTSLPELTVSIIAAIQGDLGLAMGNLIGSNVVNIFLILGVGIIIGKLRIGTTKTQRSTYIMSGVTGLFLFLYFLELPHVLAGSILLTTAFFITIDEYVSGTYGRNHEDARMHAKIKNNRFSTKDIGKFITALIGIVLGGLLTVLSVEQLSVDLGFSTTILGLSITAIATSLPELLTTIYSQKDGAEKITIGNIIGSNIYNLALIGGAVLLFASWNTITSYESTMLIAATLICSIVVVLHRGKVIPKYVGFFLISLFCTYIYFLR